ncbi:hypothetical protein C8J56DRAFT_890531 [Mycena floridula]|nr:hypothetical protein C8J56DRAFT_890531 [Mycena floridula]
MAIISAVYYPHTDMEALQLRGAARSFLRTYVPEYSGILATCPEELIAEILRVQVCLMHAKRGTLDFRSLISPENFQRILNFPYLKSWDEVVEFNKFILGLKNQQIINWWNHNYKSKYLLKCICPALSPIPNNLLAQMPSDTNVGEAQHARTNAQTGIKLCPVKAIVTFPARRKVQRSATASRKHQETAVNDSLLAQIAAEKASQKESMLRQKELEEQRTTKKQKNVLRPDRATTSSGGRVKTHGVIKSDTNTTICEPASYPAHARTLDNTEDVLDPKIRTINFLESRFDPEVRTKY